MNQLYYTIRQVSEAIGENPHVIRYWEKSFPALRPEKTKTGQRRYRTEDVALLQRIRQMLRDEGMTMVGVKRRLERRRRLAQQSDSLSAVREDLQEALKILRGEYDGV
ncbi:MAG: hypothetical protein A3G34_12960 [Candidatus Lindowbacteria bacterium RIFCSPLOWO2_12_FULL_62_27]|nr:MAG: hypothetical protein A3I06_15095 [Candidatus Lindowbacteria bacterium RIFCSPLOWO2_02_FULL_62_12]OGH62497.1 MAG: hypothetical protein A3G34_12960 [Candidatus Lindowbacteria bacterium RIFCSPLOWO2_12_FULL_62_27]